MDEPLSDSAPIARETASRLCRAEPATGETCAWYHGVWQYFRLLDLVTAPDAHADFYADVLGAFARVGKCKRILISGNADYGLLAVVLAACRSQNITPDVTVVDLCETPLQLCRWYGNRLSLTVETCASDILEFEASEPFDMICAHSFLGYFTPQKIHCLLEKWRGLLRPGGRIIGVHRIRDSDAPNVIAFTPEQAELFVERAARRAEERRSFLDVSPDDVTEWARTYVECFRIRPMRSRQELTELFAGAGMEITLSNAGMLQEVPGGPTTPGGADYAQFVATRR